MQIARLLQGMADVLDESDHKANRPLTLALAGWR
jgi:hypothetical protein